jgi:DNA polymerase III epsilon subunit-like protein
VSKEYYEAVGRFLGGWPSSFMAFDIESNGMAVDDPCVLPVEIGWCIVQDREIVSNESLVLDWFLELNEDESRDFANRLAYTHEGMTAKGNRYPFNPRFLEEHGMPPRDVLPILAARFASGIAAGEPIVGHNLFAFDRPLIERTIRDWTGTALSIPAARVIDTMVIARGLAKKKVVAPVGTRRDWMEKLARGPERCNLFHVATNLGIDVDAAMTHAAGYDALITAQVLLAMEAASQ